MRFWSSVSERFRTPKNAIWLTVSLAFISSIFGNVYALVTSLSVIGLHSSYMIPLLLKFRAKSRGVWTRRDDGPWTLGNWSAAVNSIAILWLLFTVVLFVVAPNTVQITPQYTLHYATGKIFAGLLVVLSISYAWRGRKSYRGPHLGEYSVVHDRINVKGAALADPGELGWAEPTE